MTDQERPDHWALLASQLGAETPPEKEAGEEQPSVQETASEEPVALAPEGPRYSYARPEIQKTPSDWLRLAEQLGAAVDAEAISQATEETTSTEVVEPQAPTSLPPEPPTVVMEPVESNGAVVDVVDVFSEGDEQFGNQLVDQVDTEAVEEEEERSDKKRRRRRRRRRPRKPEEARETDEDGESRSDEELELGSSDEGAEELETATSNSESLIVSPMSPDPTETPSRSKRRRRRRGSGKKKEERMAEASAEAAVDQSLMSVTGEAALVPVEDADLELSHAMLDDEDDHGEGTDEDGVDRPVHRGIPTWDEAVGIVITRNMESRTKNPGGQQRSRGNRSRN